MDIIALLQCLQPTLNATTIRQFSRIVFALFAMTGRVTMLGVSRWAGTGGSYRTIQRWFYTTIPWTQVLVRFFRQHLFQANATYILAGDEVVVTKAGKHTFGLDRFFSGLLQKVVPGLAFFALSLINTAEQTSSPIAVEQVIRSKRAPVPPPALDSPNPVVKGKPGRPRGSKNKNKANVTLTPELQQIQAMIQALLLKVAGWLSVTYIALDGHFGNNNALQMVRQCNLHLISKLRSDSALYFPYTGPQAKRGTRRKYGDRVDYRDIQAQYLKQTTVADGIETRIYQATFLHPEFAQSLNVVIIVKTNLHTQAWAHVILFSSDLTLASDKLVAYYRLRFQIEFNFRDAKQYWGLEDFMNITETAVTNAANLSFFMVNLADCSRRQICPDESMFSVLDLKAYCRGYKYVTETIKMLREKPDPILISEVFRQVACLGSIHNTAVQLSPP
jgi:DDE superfamily endonuclease